jgi:hypothetical protein
VQVVQVGFHEGPMDWIHGGSNRDPREPLRLEENLERSCVDLGPRVEGVCHQLWYQSLILSIFQAKEEAR